MYWHVSLLSSFFKILKRLIDKQPNGFMEPEFPNFLIGFDKSFNMQHQFLAMTEN